MVYFFLKHQGVHLGFYICNASCKIIEFLKNIHQFPRNLSLFTSKGKVDLDKTFIESEINNFDEISIENIDQIEENHEDDFKVKPVNCEKIGQFFYLFLEFII